PPRKPRVRSAATPDQRFDACCVLAGADEGFALVHQIAVGGPRPVPFEHREFRVVGGAALAVAKDMGELPDARQPRDQQLFHREFGRGVQVALDGAATARVVQGGREGPQMRLEPGAHLQCRGVDLDIAALGKEVAAGAEDPAALLELAAPRGKALRPPPFLHRPVLAVAGSPTYVNFSRPLSAETPP